MKHYKPILLLFIFIFGGCNLFKKTDVIDDDILIIDPNENKFLIHPKNNSIINTTHVLFEWKQQQNAESYFIEACINSDFTDCILNENTESIMFVKKTEFEWGSTYYWRVKPQYSNETVGDWIDSSYFHISEKLGNAYSISTSENLTDEITLYGSFFNFYSAAIDASGNEVWNSGNSQFVFYTENYWGQFFGSQYNPSLENNLPGIEFNSNNEIIWKEPNEHFLHHEFIQLPNGNYLGIVEEAQYGPIPYDGCDCSWTPLFQGIGYVADGITPEFKWVGDRLVEWDGDSGQELWSWSVFDNYNQNDYDKDGGTWTEAYSANRYDWTHSNAFTFDENENMIYLSSRHLSRITKISYPSGELIWNMGIEHGSGDIDFGNDLNFSFQHSLQILDNGNIVILDNGNISQTLYETEYPTSRGLEISINDNSEAEIVWQYILPQNLFGFASGNVQKLESGNYLITTVGDGGTSLEVNPFNEIIWEGKYNLSLPAGAVYRAKRISGLYAGHSSLILPKEIEFENDNLLAVNSTENILDFKIINESNYKEYYQFDLLGDGQYIVNESVEFELDPYHSKLIQININPILDTLKHEISVSLTPIHFPHYTKSYEINIMKNSNLIQNNQE